ncbi:MAG: ethylbenzene dehydrogenase-related protein [Desulfobacterales bacterium]|nr:ethylbenzene dehydrogenase-related protein [Desulfobacterales bacterium]
MGRHLYIVFFLLVVSLLGTLGFILHREVNPEWRRHQEEFFRGEKKKVTEALADADGAQQADLLKRLRFLERPRYIIRQILLDGGRRVDRCVTCHLDLKLLGEKHSKTDRFPFEEYGCTVCHGGEGRATELKRAHATLYIPRRPLYEYQAARAAGNFKLDLFHYNASGEPIPYIGSNRCLGCHLGSHPGHVARWRELKFKPLDRVKKKLEALQKGGLELDPARCLACHTTAFDQKTGQYLEDRVTCESCHGPGGFYADLMAGGKARDGAEMARDNILGTRSDRVCLNCHKPDRHVDYEGQDQPPVLTAAHLAGASPPEIDGSTSDRIWGGVREIRVPTWQLGDGPPRPGKEVFLRAAYDDGYIYFAFRWQDNTRQDRVGRWLYRDGRWRAEAGWPDALALHWQASEQVEDFQQGGCAVLCHTSGRFKEFPRMATRQEDALVDEWYWNAFAAQRAGRPGDGFLDNRVVFIAPGSKKPDYGWALPGVSAAHGNDESGRRIPETVGAVPMTLNVEEMPEKGAVPRLHPEERPRAPRPPGGESGQKELPLYETGIAEQGDSADILGKALWVDGYWTLEVKRALKTASKRDVQLDPAEKSYSFGLAVWDGAVGNQHQVATLVRLRFGAK